MLKWILLQKLHAPNYWESSPSYLLPNLVLLFIVAIVFFLPSYLVMIRYFLI